MVSDFTEEEWARLKRAPFVLALADASPQDADGAIAETWAEVRRSAERGRGGRLAALLAEELAAEDPSSTDPLASFSREPEDLSREFNSVIRLASAKASEAEVGAFREWLYFTGTAAARARDRRRLKTEPIDVGVDSSYAWTDADADALASAFRRAGFQPKIETYHYRAAGITDWVITVTVATPVIAFFQSFGSELGKDAYIHFKEWFQRVRDRGPGKGLIVVRDSRRYGGSGTKVVLNSELPDDAFEALSDELYLSKSEYIGWDPEQRAWVPVKPSSDARWKVEMFLPGHGTPHEDWQRDPGA